MHGFNGHQAPRRLPCPHALMPWTEMGPHLLQTLDGIELSQTHYISWVGGSFSQESRVLRRAKVLQACLMWLLRQTAPPQSPAAHSYELPTSADLPRRVILQA